MGARLVVGLTGGIASGKSTVTDYLAELGVPVIDADILARELVEPDTPTFEEVVATFGTGVLDAAGQLDRARLRALVFDNPERRRQLEGILHPRIRAEMQRRVQTLDTPYCVLCIPLLLETGQRAQVHRVLVVDTPPELQIRRVQARDGSERRIIDGILRAQVGRAERLAAADDVIENQGDLAELRAQVRALHRRYLTLAADNLRARDK
jgi:dephospho-CoA kinase